MNKKPDHWLIWHPHQKLWNWNLVKWVRANVPSEPIATGTVKSIVYLDTLLLGLGMELNGKNRNRSGYSPEKHINYFDLGTHKEGREVQWVYNEVLSKLPNPYSIYAFEANPSSFDSARKKVAHVENLKFFNLALVHEMPESGNIRLFLGDGGLGDSIYREGKGEYVEVEAKKFTDVLKDEDIKLDDSINIIRMNIEGCEYDVIQDLADHGLTSKFDGYYGMWDDVGKIDGDRDRQFRELLKKEGVYPYPFNGRDMNIKMRKKYITRSLLKSIKG